VVTQFSRSHLWLVLLVSIAGAGLHGCATGEKASSELPPDPVDSGTRQDAATPPDDDASVVDADAGEDAGYPGEFNEGQWVVGNARFTAITPTLIRLEHHADKRFVDEKSYFAVGRDARFHYALATQQGSTFTLDTGTLTLTYTDDGAPFSEQNLTATVRRGSEQVAFEPAAPNRDNLGGTTRTLDNWTGAAQLDDGILTRAGWYRLDDSQGHLLVDDWVRAREPGGQDWYLFGYGLDFKAALASLTTIGGAVPMPRKSVLGAWYSRYWDYTSAEFLAIAQEYDDHDFPLDVMVLDMDWHLPGWTGWTWNRDLIPDPPALLSELHARGLDVTLNVHPADSVAPHEEAYGDFMRALGRDPASNETVPFDAANKSYMDALFSEVHAPLTAAGNDFFWLDWQQQPNTGSLPTLGNIPWLNYLYYRYEQRDNMRGLSFSRWGGFGDHRHPIHFSGDASTSFEMLAFEVPFTSTSSNSGLFFWTHDIGGHQGGRNEESYTRWCQFGAFSAALRSHSMRAADLDRRPWNYPDWAEASMRKSFQLRSRFFPYLYSAVREASHRSLPLVRPLYVEHPELEDAYRQPQQYLFGSALLVAPVAEPGAGSRRLGRQAVWLPPGTYYDYFTGERFEGPGERLVAATIDELPLFVKAGVPVPMQPFTRRMATQQTRELVVRCYPGSDGQSSSFDLYEDDGVTMEYADGRFALTKLTCTREGGAIRVHVAGSEGSYDGQPATRSYVIEVPATGRASAASVDGATTAVEYDAAALVNRVRVAARPVGSELEVSLTVQPASDDTLRKHAFAQRTGVAATGTLAQMVQAAWTSAATDAEKLAVLAAAGAGAWPKNDNPYAYPAVTHFAVYEQPWAKPDVELSTDWLGGVQEVELASVSFAGHTADVRKLGRIDFAHPGTNLAPLAVAAFSSLENDTTRGIADQKVGGYPQQRAEEWSTAGQTTGASVTLTWPAARSISSVVLYDRINANDHITSGTLSFSDGSEVAVGALPNVPTEGPLRVDFAARSVTWVRFTVTAVAATTENVGLAEMAVYGSP
jgi:hypothetical protein